MRKYLMMVTMLLLAIDVSFAGPFIDTQNHWAVKDIETLYNMGIVNGTSETTFKPEGILNIETWMTLLLRNSDYDIDELSTDSWYAPYLRLAQELEIYDNDLMLGAKLSRADASILLGRLLLKENLIAIDELQAMTLIDSFTDLDVNDEYVLAIGACLESKLLKGKGIGLFAPEDHLTRAEAAVILKRLLVFRSEQSFDNELFYALSAQSQHAQLIDMIKEGYKPDMNFSWAAYTLVDDKLTLDFDSYNSYGFRLPQEYGANLKEYKSLGISTSLSVFADLTLIEAVVETVDEMTALFFNRYDTKQVSDADFTFDGLTLNFEGETSDKDLYPMLVSAFSREAKVRGLDLKITVGPNQISMIPDMIDQVDSVILMFHDYDSKYLSQDMLLTDIPVTPAAPINLVMTDMKKVIELNLTPQQKKKLNLQINFSIVQWKMDRGILIGNSNELGVLPYRPTYAKLDERLLKLTDSFQDFSKYSKLSEQPYLRYIDDDGIENVIWYEDGRSVSSKIELAHIAGYGGVSYWRVGNIPDGDWKYYLNIFESLDDY
ncbi:MULTISPECIES: glycosyl hydrolase family 18 protein [unclassified Fusibacter]|uniref:glycosyl hydrolase family 18 protein n=1 Tax=unclassified Fusibacter TaxID=2624464 RepID=UPI0010126CD5|nr:MULTISPECIES: glycosyl hydrolase family 18 protein [unclassified Fusibacter]MCK8058842.1 glycosyl hydrolase family 18 protein [Fusibacter sp. A2]NPE21916.1 hypothetical protein [Fusibacter sp. A1]RXV61486.1 hypothetical protein DWB64_08730 [Fusibacter sp. A1]